MKDDLTLNDRVFRPLFKWAGGKRWFMQRYAPAFESFSQHRIVEPFAGGLAFSFAMKPKNVLANDINQHLINVYRQVKEKNFRLPKWELSREYYDNARLEFNELIKIDKINTFRAAQLFWILNRMGFNGLCRFNKAGFFNTPYGDYERIYDDFEWKAYKKLFENWEFTTGSFAELVLGKKDFLFCDPPYDDSLPVYSKERFGFDDHVKLAAWVSQQKNPALIMNHATPRMIDLYKNYGFELTTVWAPRTISASALSRKPRQELIASYNFSWKELSKKI